MADIEFQGTGGIIEGNLGTANVNVNLEPALQFGLDASGDIGAVHKITQTGFTHNNRDISFSCWHKAKAPWTVAPSKTVLFSMVNGTQTYKTLWFGLEGTDDAPHFRGYLGNGSTYDSTDLYEFSDEEIETWNHYAVTVSSGNSTTFTVKLYVNGVLRVTDSSFTKAYDSTARAPQVGDDGYLNLDGYLKDWRCYGTELSADDIKILASKMNVSNSLLANSAELQLHYKLDGTDISSTTVTNAGNAGSSNGTLNTVTGLVSHYDEFSVDVYDNSTTTDGTFTVTQGKLECLSLTCVDLDGTNDYITFPSSASVGAIGTADYTIAGWFNTDSSNQQVYFTTGPNAANGGSNDNLFISIDSGGGYLGLGSATAWKHQAYTTITQNVWHQFILTRVGTVSKWYLDGVLVGTGTDSTTWTASTLGYLGQNGGGTQDFNGEMRDVRIYDYGLSDDQAASLYSGNYNVTPDHWWKIDEATQTETATIEDYGTGTDADGTGVSLGTWVNGTLDLDGITDIEANGFFSCPRGNLDLESELDINCTDVATQWIHNNGKVRILGSGSHIMLYPNNATFFNIDLAKSSGHDVKLRESIKILGTLDLTGANDYWIVDANGASGNVTMTMGDDNNQATIDSDQADKLRFIPHSTREITITGHSTLKPCLVVGADWMWDYAAEGAPIKLANMNFDPDIVTHSSGSHLAKITLTGDCEFDNFTLSAGDVLDLNGQRAEFSGNLSNQSTGSGNGIDYDGMLYFTGSGRMDSDGASRDLDKLTVVQQGTSTSDADLAGDNLIKTFFYNQPGVTQKNARGAIQTIIGTGTATCGSDESPDYTNLSVATGGTLDGSSSTLTVAGDFTTSGGLIGKSAVVFDNNTSHKIDFTLASGPSTAVTLEAWVKSDNVAQYQSVMVDANQVVHLAIYLGKLYIWTDTDADVRINVFGTSTLTDNKWHHLALTWDASTDTMLGYVDGKLEISAASVGSTLHTTPTTFAIGRRQDFGSQAFDGVIAMTRIFNVARTQAQLRTDMFNDFDSMSSTTGLLKMFQFDEGTGTSVDDVSANSNTGTITGASFAGVGTFTRGTSTLKMTGTNKKITYSGDTGFNKVTIATGGDSNTIYLNDIVGNNSGIIVYHTLEQESGKLASTSNEYIQIGRTFGNVLVASGKGAIAFADVAKWFVFQNGTSGTMNFPSASSADKDLTIQTMFINSSSSIETISQGNLTVTATLFVDGGNTFNANSKTIAAKVVDIDNGTLDLRNSNLNFSVTHSGDQLNLATTATLLSGNSAITGNSVSSKTNFYAPSAGGFELVGDIKHMDLQADGDLTVIGSVTACNITGTGANIRQWHHTLDTQQLLDADEAGDDDLRLTKPALDNALELMTK